MIEKQSVLFAALNNLIVRFGQHLISLFKHIIIAGYIGLSSQVDIFYMALAIYGVLITSWAVVFDVLAIPKLVKYQTNKKYENFNLLSSSILLFTFVISIFFSSLFYFFGNIISLSAFGFSSEKKVILEESFKWLFPAILFYLPYFSLCSILKSLRLFSLVNTIEFCSTLILVVILFFFIEKEFTLYWSYSLSVTFSFLLAFLFVRRSVNLKFYNPFNSLIKQLLPSIPPLLFIHSCFYLFSLTDRFFVTFLNNGDIAALTYATVFVVAVPQIIGASSFFLTAYSEESNIALKSSKFTQATSYIIFISVPIIIFFLTASENFISIILERGAFKENDTLRVINIIYILSFIIIPFSFQTIIDQIYQVEKKFSFIVKIKLFGFLINICLNYIFIFMLKLGVIGAALGTTISYSIVMILSFYNLKYLKISVRFMKHLTWLLWLLIFNLPTLLVINLIKDNINNYLVIFVTIIIIIFSTIAAVLTFFGPEKKLVLEIFSRIKKFKL